MWDPSFVILAMWASVEAIFLSTFVLIAQNRMSAAADKRADLDLQISLLAEHEITKLASLLEAVAQRLEVPVDPHGELAGSEAGYRAGGRARRDRGGRPGGGPPDLLSRVPSVQPPLAPDMTEFDRPDDAGVCDAHRGKRPVQIV